MLELWRYVRDVLIVIGVLVIGTGLVVSWWLFCLCAVLCATIASAVVDYKKSWNKK